MTNIVLNFQVFKPKINPFMNYLPQNLKIAINNPKLKFKTLKIILKLCTTWINFCSICPYFTMIIFEITEKKLYSILT